VVTLFVLLAALGVAHVGLLRAVLHSRADLEAIRRDLHASSAMASQPYDDSLLVAEMAQLRLVVGEAVSQRERNDRRIENVVRRAQKELREHGLEHGGLEAEAYDLRLVDGEGSDQGIVPEVQAPVGRYPDDHLPSGIPGLTKGQRREFMNRRA